MYKKRDTVPSVDRFWKYVAKSDGCWEWQGSVAPNGYGKFSADSPARTKMYAHRFSYQLHKGEIPDRCVVMHTCDNRRCVNPSHLQIGTQKQNLHDMIAKGRHPKPGATHCTNGHEYTLENTGIEKGSRRCKICLAATRARAKQNAKPRIRDRSKAALALKAAGLVHIQSTAELNEAGQKLLRGYQEYPGVNEGG